MRRDPPDLRKLSRAVIAMALRDAELEANAHAAEGTAEARMPDATGHSTTEKEGTDD